MSGDGSIRHSGDEREGDEIGDDEKISVYLPNVHPMAKYIGFVINSYSGQELDDVSRAACHLFDPVTNTDIARYAMANTKALDKHTALVMACLYRGNGQWFLTIISEAAQGRTAHSNVDELQRHLRHFPPMPPLVMQEPEIILTAMPEAQAVDEEIIVVPQTFLPAYFPAAAHK